MVFSQEIKVSEKILNENKVDVDSFTSYARISHTDNFILVDKNGKVYKSCLTRNPEGCPDHYLLNGYVNTPISEEVVQLKKGGSYWCKTSVILSLLEENYKNWDKHNQHYFFWCDKNGWVKSKSP